VAASCFAIPDPHHQTSITLSEKTENEHHPSLEESLGGIAFQTVRIREKLKNNNAFKFLFTRSAHMRNDINRSKLSSEDKQNF
jgi:hypothetical protein